MIFKYKVTTPTGQNQSGSIDAANQESAINSLQRRGLIILSIKDEKENTRLHGGFQVH